MSAPHRVLRFCLLLAGLLPCVLSVRAETGKLNVHVTDCLNAPVMNVTVGVVNGDSRKVRTADGDVQIPLSPQTHASSSVMLQLLSAPADLVMLSPWDHRALVPAFDSSESVHVVLARRGDDRVLHSAACLGSLARRLTLDPGAAQAAGLPGASTPQSRLQLVARDYGLPSDRIEQAILDLRTGENPQNRALAELYAKQYDKAIGDFQLAEAAAQQHLSEAYFGHGYTLYLQGKPVEAERLYKQALDLDPQNPVYLNNYAVTLRMNGDAGRAEAMFRRVLSLQTAEWGANDVRLVPAMNNLAQALLAQDKGSEALKLLQDGLALRRAKLRKTDLRIAYSEADLGALYASQNRCNEAVPLLADANTLYHSTLTIRPEDDPTKLKKPPPQQGQQAQSVGSFKMQQRPRLAPAAAPEAELKGSMSRGVSSRDVTNRHMQQVSAGLPSQSRILISEASCMPGAALQAELLSQALSAARTEFGETHLETAYAMIALGEFDQEHGKRDEASTMLKDALDIYGKQLGPANPEVVSLRGEIDDVP